MGSREAEAPLGYPRPQLFRDSFISLDGPWEYAFSYESSHPRYFEKGLIVPFSPEVTPGIKRTLKPGEHLFCRKVFSLPKDFVKDLVILRFEAVDQVAKVYLNGNYLGRHVGGYLPFSFEISRFLRESNELVVDVEDDTDASWHARGKQSLKPHGIWYRGQSGIWLPVWLESVPSSYVKSLRITPLYDLRSVRITVVSDVDETAEIILEGRTVETKTNTEKTIPVRDFHPWSPDDPHLYEFSVELGKDKVRSYFGMRKIEVRRGKDGISRIFLNDKPVFLSALLDQGYYGESLLTPPGDEAMIRDIEFAKKLGYNALRKHVKIEPRRWYYHCDRLGMLVLQDFVNGGTAYKFGTIVLPLFTGINKKDDDYGRFGRLDEEGRKEFIAEAEATVRHLYNYPSIIYWTIFNEGWGQFDADEIAELIRKIDGTRLIDEASGWHDQKGGDVSSRHVYFHRFRFRKDPDRADVLSEFGGYALFLPGHGAPKKAFGYRKFKSKGSLTKAIVRLYERDVIPNVKKGLSGAVYTQLSDVETELNGLVTNDRKEEKVDAEAMRRINGKIQEALGEK